MRSDARLQYLLRYIQMGHAESIVLAQAILPTLCYAPFAAHAMLLMLRLARQRPRHSALSAQGRVYDRYAVVQVYIGKGYVNNPRAHDVVFVVEQQPFYAHKLALSASSEAFRAMFDSGCVEGVVPGIPQIAIPNLTRNVFEAMMMFVYTGELGPAAKSEDSLPQLLQAADQYLLEPLKAHCADLIARQLSPANVLAQYELARQFNCSKLMHSAMAYIILEHKAIQVRPPAHACVRTAGP
jgi:hypothetical protein